MKTDLEILEAAGKAAGIALVPYTWNKGTDFSHDGFTVADEGPDEWNPLEDDGEALQLAVMCGVDFYEGDDGRATYAGYYDKTPRQRFCIERHDAHEDKFAATRRAIVRAAAAMADR